MSLCLPKLMSRWYKRSSLLTQCRRTARQTRLLKHVFPILHSPVLLCAKAVDLDEGRLPETLPEQVNPCLLSFLLLLPRLFLLLTRRARLRLARARLSRRPVSLAV